MSVVHQVENPKLKKQKGLPKRTVDIIRTTQRNNIELTAIADNKANVLLSLNAIMLTLVVPLVSAYNEWILETNLFIPLIILSITCLLTIYYAAKVLKPSNFDLPRDATLPDITSSPFFFGNFYKMNADEYYENLKTGLSDPSITSAHLAQDLYYIGKRLGYKMSWIRLAFNIFTFGVFLSMASTAIVLFFSIIGWRV